MSHSHFTRQILNKLRLPSTGLKIDSSWLNTATLGGTPGPKGDKGDRGIQGLTGPQGIPGTGSDLSSPDAIGSTTPNTGYFTELVGYRPIVKVSGRKDLRLDDRGTYQWCVEETEIVIPGQSQTDFYRGDEIVIRRHTLNAVVINASNVTLEGLAGEPIGTVFEVDQSVLLKKIDGDRWIVEPISIPGADGSQGPQGVPGPIGATGAQGIPGTSGGASTPAQRYEYSAAVTIPRIAVPPTAKTVRIKIKGGAGGSGSGARGAIGIPCSGGSSGSGGNESSNEFDLAEIAALHGFVRSDFWIDAVLGAAGILGTSITTNDTDGMNGMSGGTSYIRFQNGIKSINRLVMQAGGGASGLGGRRGGTTTGGAIVIAPGSIVGPAGANGRNGGGDAGQSSNSGTASGGGGAGRGAVATAAAGGNGGNASIANYGLLCTGGVGGPVSPSPGVDANSGSNALTNIPVGASAGAGGGGAYNPTGRGGKGGDGHRGSSGGGGGASDNGFDSGAAGKGGDGYILIEFIF